MAKIIVTAAKINVRSRVPDRLPSPAGITGTVVKGYTFDGTEVPADEVPNPDLGKWYRDGNGHFYWGGGVMEVGDNVPAAIAVNTGDVVDDSGIQQWMTDLQLTEIWKHATGKGVGIAVVDTGISANNPDLVYNKNSFYVFDTSVSLLDTNGHGTHCAGLISARNKNGNVIGAAPNCNLYVCKISEEGSLPEPETIRYAAAIDWCATQKNIHVISISWASFINDEGIISKIQASVNNAIKNNKVVVCAMGDASQFNDPGPLYPSALSNTIGIGSIPVENVIYPYINNSLTTIIQGVDIPSYGLDNQIVKMTGTSQSNAILAGIISLIIEKKKFVYSPSEIKNILKSLSDIQTFEGIEIPVLNGNLLLKYFQS
ncbi:MAG: S8/S53 family peptidase [Bacteroidota bacterium]